MKVALSCQCMDLFVVVSDASVGAVFESAKMSFSLVLVCWAPVIETFLMASSPFSTLYNFSIVLSNPL